MLHKITGNEPATPIECQIQAGAATGLTIRQHFAAMAMQGMLSDDINYISQTLEQRVLVSVQIADALIKELNNDNSS